MRKYRSNNPAKMQQYAIMLNMARDKSSTLYQKDGTPNRAASHRAHFWNGYAYGFKYQNLTPTPDSIAYCTFRAGVDYAAELAATTQSV